MLDMYANNNIYSSGIYYYYPLSKMYNIPINKINTLNFKLFNDNDLIECNLNYKLNINSTIER